MKYGSIKVYDAFWRHILYIILFFVCIFCHGEDKIELRIDGKIYEREQPKTLEEAIRIINGIADINNNTDKTLVTLKESYDSLYDKYQETLNKNKERYTRLLNELELIKENNTQLKKEIKKIPTFKLNGILFIGYGTVFDYTRKMIGHDIGASFDYRVFRNLHLSLNLNGTIYSNIGVFIPRVGLSIGYALF